MNQKLNESALSISDWTVRYRGRDSDSLSSLSLEVKAGECVAVIGRSGAGKTTLLHTLTGLNNQPEALVAGACRIAGADLLVPGDFRAVPGTAAHRAWLLGFQRQLFERRGQGLFTVFQEPRAALNPYQTLKQQLIEASNLAGCDDDPEALLAQVDIDREFLTARPDALSVGMCQRVQIAMALALRSKVVLADEPLARIDPRGRGIVFDLLGKLMAAGSSLVLVSHDPELVRRLANSVVMLQQGYAVEQGSTEHLFDESRSHHPFFLSFRAAYKKLREDGIAWSPEKEAMTLSRRTESGCPLRASCWAAQDACETWLPEIASKDGHGLFCARSDLQKVEDGVAEALETGEKESPTLILKAEGLAKRFALRRGFFRKEVIEAVSRASLELYTGETVALVGESGGGKTSLVNMLSGLTIPDEGHIQDSAGQAWPILGTMDRREKANRFQLVFQEADQALNPSWSVLESVAEAYTMNYAGLSQGEALGLGTTLLAELWLEGELILRRPQSLSGGERKRASLARALAAVGWGTELKTGQKRQPGLLFLDEPLSGLDPVVQGQCLKVLLKSKRQLSLSLFLITHDLAMAKALADRIFVMYGGEIVEVIGAQGDPLRHPFSLQLLNPWSKAPEPNNDAALGCVFSPCCDHDSRGSSCTRQLAPGGFLKSDVACWAV
ncbi:MAG: ATP-binding cassette domain-containing protein [Planctomycetota bacterium]|nr:ATP-binding cassette domain-containing protein [Planctomycetota bacterium]